jgi:hypothetical protein
MNWLRSLLSFSLLIVLGGCGVKGDPLPPEKPPELGRGRPTYKRATEGIQIEKSKPATEEEEEEDDERK